MSKPSKYNLMINRKLKAKDTRGLLNLGDFGFAYNKEDLMRCGHNCCDNDTNISGGSGFGKNNMGRLGNGEVPYMNNNILVGGSKSGEGKYKKDCNFCMTSYNQSSFGSTSTNDYKRTIPASAVSDMLEDPEAMPEATEQTDPTVGSGRRRKMLKGMGKNAIVGGGADGTGDYDEVLEGKGFSESDIKEQIKQLQKKLRDMKSGKGKSGGNFLDTLGSIVKTGAQIAPLAMMAMGKPRNQKKKKSSGADFITENSQLKGVVASGMSAGRKAKQCDCEGYGMSAGGMSAGRKSKQCDGYGMSAGGMSAGGMNGGKKQSEWAKLVSKYSKEKGGVKAAIQFIKANYEKKNGSWIKK